VDSVVTAIARAVGSAVTRAAGISAN
jgi:hypothetical protein